MESILLLDSDPVSQIKLKTYLNELGYFDIMVVSNLNQAIEILTKKIIDLIILDILLAKDTTQSITSHPIAQDIPMIFTTISEEKSLYDSIEGIQQFGLLTKPIDLNALRSMVNLLTKSHIRTNYTSLDKVAPKLDTFFIRQNKKRHRIQFSDIIWLEAEDNYTFIHTVSAKYAIKKPLRHIIKELDDRFGQCHKKYCVNTQHVQAIKTHAIILNNIELPMSYFYKKPFITKLNILKNH